MQLSDEVEQEVRIVRATSCAFTTIPEANGTGANSISARAVRCKRHPRPVRVKGRGSLTEGAASWLFLSTLFETRFNGTSLENPSVPLADFDRDFNGLGFRTSASGITVTRERALGFPALYRAFDLISNYVGKIPLEIKRKTPNGSEIDRKHPNYRHLLKRPSPEMSAFVWKKTMEYHRMDYGNGYTFLRRRGDGQILEFVLLAPEQTWPIRVGGELFYMTTNSEGRTQVLLREDVIHIKSMGFDGLQGLGLRFVGRDAIGAGIATIEYRSRFYRSGAMPLTVIEVPNAMPPEKKKELADGWNQIHAGVGNAHKTGVLTNNATAKVLSASNRDNQQMENERHSAIDVSNFAGLPPHKLGSDARVSYNSLEQENQALLDDTLEPRFKDWEEELEDKILTQRQKERDTHEICFDRERLINADIQSRAEFLSKATGAPWMKVDEARKWIGMNELPGKEGDVLHGPPGQHAPSDEKPSEDDDPPKPPQGGTEDDDKPKEDERAVAAHKQLLLHACHRMADRVAKSMQRKEQGP